ncbi:MAG TPA: hypothetical protein VJ505_15695 [Holophagaceae bacterium]|nr:hypothetical protein [Holophagaceae bacterium]
MRIPYSALLILALRAQEPTIAHLERMRVQAPRDPLVLVNLAALRAGEGQGAEVEGLLAALAEAPGGLDPSDLRSLAPWRGTEAFRHAVASARAQFPPVVRSRRAFTLLESDLRPEGMAFDSRDRVLFVGSAKARILRISADGEVRDFAQVEGAGAWVLGMQVDERRRQLWAVVDDPRAWSDPAAGGATLQSFDLATGQRLRTVRGPAFGALNDLVVTPGGTVYATNSSDGSVVRGRPGATGVEPFLPPGAVPEANGIALAADGRALYVAGWYAVHRVDLRTRRLVPLPAPEGIVSGNLDGLYVHRGHLIGIQNGVHPGRVLRFHLDAPGRRILDWEVLEAYHPEADGLTTGALDGDSFLFFRNNQLKAMDDQGRPREGRTLKPITVARLSLR